MKLNKKFALLAVVVLALGWLILDAVSQPGPESLKGGFQEKAFLRNEQNTGPVTRIYVATVKDSLWDEMITYGNYKPHTKYGRTIVYYFREGSPFPSDLTLDDNHFSAKYQKHCLARYEKSPMGQVILNKKPFIEQ